LYSLYIFVVINEGDYSCCSVSNYISLNAEKFYSKEFKLGSGAYWIFNYFKGLDFYEDTPSEEVIMLRQFLVSWFKEWSLDNEYYLEY